MVWCFPKWMLLLRAIFLFYFFDFLLHLFSVHPRLLSLSGRASLLSMARICVHANHSFYYYLSPNTTNKGSGRTKRRKRKKYINTRACNHSATWAYRWKFVQIRLCHGKRNEGKTFHFVENKCHALRRLCDWQKKNWNQKLKGKREKSDKTHPLAIASKQNFINFHWYWVRGIVSHSNRLYECIIARALVVVWTWFWFRLLVSPSSLGSHDYLVISFAVRVFSIQWMRCLFESSSRALDVH